MAENTLISISIPRAWADKIKERIKGTEFNSVSSYVNYIVGQVVSNIEKKEKKEFFRDDEELVKKKLKSLGYMG